jgi:YebC/PmpR family DNA-binding regulatory protein
MAGHNKWSKIKRKKSVNDVKRSKIASRIIREIQIAVREGGPNPEGNPRLRIAIQNAKKNNIPKHLIENAIHRQKDKDEIQEIVYEAYAPGGVALLIETATDNTNRTVGQIRATLSRGGGNLATAGAVSYQFQRKGTFLVPSHMLNEEKILAIIDAGAEDVDLQEELSVITVPFELYGKINQTLSDLGIEVEEASLTYIPTITVTLDMDQAQKVLALIEKLEELEDVQEVYHNMELTQELENYLTEQV